MMQTAYFPARAATRFCRIALLSALIIILLGLVMGTQAGSRISRDAITDDGATLYPAAAIAVLRAADHKADPVSHDIPSDGPAEAVTIPYWDPYDLAGQSSFPEWHIGPPCLRPATRAPPAV